MSLEVLPWGRGLPLNAMTFMKISRKRIPRFDREISRREERAVSTRSPKSPGSTSRAFGFTTIFVYLAAESHPAKGQMARRADPETTLVLPAPAETVLILVAAIKHPDWSPERIGASLGIFAFLPTVKRASATIFCSPSASRTSTAEDGLHVARAV